MNITGGIILVQIEDNVYQVDVNSDEVIEMLRFYQFRTNQTINIIDKPLVGITLAKRADNKIEG